MYALLLVGFLAFHSVNGMSGNFSFQTERTLRYFQQKMREHEEKYGLVCELKENKIGPYFQCRDKEPTFKEKVAKIKAEAREYEKRTGWNCVVKVDWVNETWKRVCTESEEIARKRLRQEYLKALEIYKEQARQYEKLHDAVCEIIEYPEKYAFRKECYKAEEGRRAGALFKPTDVKPVPRDRTKKLRSVLTSN